MTDNDILNNFFEKVIKISKNIVLNPKNGNWLMCELQ